MALLCTNCGTQNSDENEYCSICGVRLSNSNPVVEGETMRMERIIHEIETPNENEEPISVMIEKLLNEVKTEIDETDYTSEPTQTINHFTDEKPHDESYKSRVSNEPDIYSETSVIERVTSEKASLSEESTVKDEPLHTNNQQYSEPQQEEGEWLDENAVREIWGIQLEDNEQPQQEETVNIQTEEEEIDDDDEMLPDGSPEWLSQIREEEEQQEIERKQEERQRIFSFFNHPILITSIVALVMAIASVSMVLSVFRV